MKSLPVPLIPPQIVFNNIIARKRLKGRRVLSKAKKIIFQAYLEYKRETLCTLETIVLKKHARKAMLDCYNSGTNALRDLKQKVKDVAGSFCPYCGIEPPRTIDHFFPKELFPEFSVHPLNLIACCHHCNEKKALLYVKNNMRLFVHAYFDFFEETATCLKCKIIWDAENPSFEFFLKPDCPQILPDDFKVLQEHTSRLGLLSAYAEAAGEEFSDKEDWITEEDTFATVKERVAQNIVRKRKKHGPLSWRASLWEAVFHDDAAITYLQTH